MVTVNVSPYFEKRRTAYYDALQAVRERGDIDTWLSMFLDAVSAQAIDAVAAQNNSPTFVSATDFWCKTPREDPRINSSISRSSSQCSVRASSSSGSKSRGPQRSPLFAFWPS